LSDTRIANSDTVPFETIFFQVIHMSVSDHTPASPGFSPESLFTGFHYTFLTLCLIGAAGAGCFLSP